VKLWLTGLSSFQRERERIINNFVGVTVKQKEKLVINFFFLQMSDTVKER
jgi:hypothetical protein